MADIKPIQFSLEGEKVALSIKYLINLNQEQNKQELVGTLNKVYPFTQYPLSAVPPIQFYQTNEETKIISKDLPLQLSKYSYIVLSGGITVLKGVHNYTENRFINENITDRMFFNLTDEGVMMEALPYSSYLRIHKIWIERAKQKKYDQTYKYIKEKLLKVPYFASLTFDQFEKCCKSAFLKTLGPEEVLLRAGDVPYHMYVVSEGELVCEKSVNFIKDFELWYDIQNQVQWQEDGVSDEMFKYLTKQPKENEETFEVIFKIKNVSQGQIIGVRQTLTQQSIPYTIRSSLKTKIICIKYPDLYNLKGERLQQIRQWVKFDVKDVILRKDYYYQLEWKYFKDRIQKQAHFEKISHSTFDEFLRTAINLSQKRYYYFPNKIGEGKIMQGPPSVITKFKDMAYRKE